ncbi:MAG: DUF1298 domain-containing protein [Rhodoferax sp.]|nr:DUF1298 domain-containing protein [Rhodoferax sp.]
MQRVEHDLTGPRWVPDADFRIERHVLRETLAPARPRPRRTRGAAASVSAPGAAAPVSAPGAAASALAPGTAVPASGPGAAAAEQAALQQRLAELAVTPLDPAHPLWQFHLVEHYQGGSALLARIHHCIADGIALIAVMQSLVDGGQPPAARPVQPASSPDAAPAHPASPHPASAAAPSAAGLLGWLDQALQALPGRPAAAASAAHGAAAGSGPGLPASRPLAAELGRLALQASRDAAALALMDDDSPTRLKGQPGRHKRVAWCEPIPLDEVKAVGRALRCSVNDVLLSCVAGALGGYLRARGDRIDGHEIRAMVPVNLRPLSQAHQLGNRFGLAPVVLPIGLQHPLERLYAVRQRMGELKGSLQPLLAFGLLAVAGLLVKPAQDALLGLFSRKTTAVMTNVPGPPRKLRLCGATLEQSLFWVPQSGTVGLGVSILSYGGGVQFGIISDAGLCPDPQAIIDRFEPEFSSLSVLTLMLPWGD